MRSRPIFFERVRREAQERWNKLEQDPILAAPWHQLFRQVQSPRHVISELLQNAEDAGATWARVRVEEGAFHFEYDGEDFDEDSLKSLCRFGFSNKRHLHTIGFRGVGFKSTFSLGATVELWTPTLAIAFNQKRFTQPVWREAAPETEHITVRVAFDNSEKEEQIRREIRQWIETAVPLLFFRNIQQLELNGQRIIKKDIEAGPIPRSEWITLQSSTEYRVLCITSEEAGFPEDAIAEVRSERGDRKFSLPKCSVQIVLFLSGNRLYTVLPTEVNLHSLPFSCNAPFLQDPARLKIKEPSNSPTNRWLLARLGNLAASAMIGWLRNTSLTREERTQAYELLPKPTQRDGSLDAECMHVMTEAFQQTLNGKPFLLTEKGKVTHKHDCLALPGELTIVWPQKVILELFGANETQILAHEIEEDTRVILVQWDWLKSIKVFDIMHRLRQPPYPPRPENSRQLLTLWGYLELQLRKDRYPIRVATSLGIVPVRNSQSLLPANQVLVLGQKEPKLNSEDWNFLVSRVAVGDPHWVRLMDQHSPKKTLEEMESPDDLASRAAQLFQNIGLGRRVGTQQLFEKVAAQIFEPSDFNHEDAFQMALIAAQADIYLPESFVYLCRKGHKRASEGPLIDSNLDLETLLPSEWLSEYLLNEEYSRRASSRNIVSWQKWTVSSKSRLRLFPLPQPLTETIWGCADADHLCDERGHDRPDYSVSRGRDCFTLKDYDFESAIWAYWEGLAQQDANIWVKVARSIYRAWSPEWEERVEARLRRGPQRSSAAIGCDDLPAVWLHRLRNLPCLPDRYNKPRIPSELMRLTPYTEPLLNIEPFLHPDFDNPANHRFLDYLGVRNTPTNVDGLLQRLRALAGLKEPPHTGLVDIYRAIDRVMFYLSSEQLTALKEIFNHDPLIRTEEGAWQTAANVFQRNDENIPGVSVVIREVDDLQMWGRLGVLPQPTLELALDWLTRLKRRKRLGVHDRLKVTALMRRVPQQVWNMTGRWLDLTGRWVPVEELRWYTRNLQNASDYFDWVNEKTADMTMLDTGEALSFAKRLSPLEQNLRNVVDKGGEVISVLQPAWISALASGLLRMSRLYKQNTSGHESEPRSPDLEAACELARTRWESVVSLAVVPYLEESPAGPQQIRKAMWYQHHLYVVGEEPNYHRELVDQLRTRFTQPEIQEAVATCVGRNPGWITAYLEANLQLLPDIPVYIRETLQEMVAETGTVIEHDKECVIHFNTGHPVKIDLEQAQTELESLGESARVVNRSRQPNRQNFRSYLDAYFRTIGFEMDYVSNAYMNQEGDRIQRDAGLRIWSQHNASGQLAACYWLAFHNFDKGIEVPVEVWEFVKLKPDIFFLLVPEDHASMRIYPGRWILEQMEAGLIKLFPATYRIRKTI